MSHDPYGHIQKLSAEQRADFEKRIAAAQERSDGNALEALYASPEGQDFWVDCAHELAGRFPDTFEGPKHMLYCALIVTQGLKHQLDVERARVRHLQERVRLLERPSILRRLGGRLLPRGVIA